LKYDGVALGDKLLIYAHLTSPVAKEKTMKYLRPITLAICLVLAFTLGTLWRSHSVMAQEQAPTRPFATSSSLGMSCAVSQPSAVSGNSASGAIVCVGDLDGTGKAKVLLANMNSSFTLTTQSYWNVGVYNLSSGSTVWEGNKAP
jgi:hypothetical protein